MSVNLTTQYLGMTLKNPLVASASPLTGNLDILKRLEDAGASAAVMPSLFEEQLEHEEMEIHSFYEYHAHAHAESLTHFPELLDYNTGPEEYLQKIEQAKQELSIPIIGSLNGWSEGGWIRYAKAMEGAGADALELNVYFVPTDLTASAADIEKQYLDLVRSVRDSINIPLSVKIGPNFTSLPHFTQQLVAAGADGLVLFNRYLEADIDLENLEFRPDLVLSHQHEARGPIRWIGILRDEFDISFAATSGVHQADSILKLLLAGADATMMATILIKKGPEFVAELLKEMTDWLNDREYESSRADERQYESRKLLRSKRIGKSQLHESVSQLQYQLLGDNDQSPNRKIIHIRKETVMTTETLSKALKESTYFQDFPDDHLDELVSLANEVEFKPNEIIFQENQPADDVYLILDGKVSLIICTDKTGCRQIAELKGGDLIGWSTILKHPRLTDTAKTLTAVKALVFNGAKLLQLCDENPKFGYAFMHKTADILCDRLNATRWRLLDIHGNQLPEVALESD